MLAIIPPHPLLALMHCQAAEDVMTESWEVATQVMTVLQNQVLPPLAWVWESWLCRQELQEDKNYHWKLEVRLLAMVQ